MRRCIQVETSAKKQKKHIQQAQKSQRVKGRAQQIDMLKPGEVSRLLQWQMPLSALDTSIDGPAVVLDGANLCIAYGRAVAPLLGTSVHARSRGIELAMQYCIHSGCSSVRCIIPYDFAVNTSLGKVCDGLQQQQQQQRKLHQCKHSNQNSENVVRMQNGRFVNQHIMRLRDQGFVQLVERNRRADDDAVLLKDAMKRRAFIVSNDSLTDFASKPGKAAQRPPQHAAAAAAGLIAPGRRIRRFLNTYRLSFRFDIAPGLSKTCMQALMSSEGNSALQEGCYHVDDASVPAEFVPQANNSMLQLYNELSRVPG